MRKYPKTLILTKSRGLTIITWSRPTYNQAFVSLIRKPNGKYDMEIQFARVTNRKFINISENKKDHIIEALETQGLDLSLI